jgi:hypothetical protein
MQSLYSNYDYREISQAYPDGRGALKYNQTFIANAQELTDAMFGLLIVLQTDSVSGTLFIEFTNTISEQFEYTQTDVITQANPLTITRLYQVPKKARYFRVKFLNTSNTYLQTILLINTYILNTSPLITGLDNSGNGQILKIDSSGSINTNVKTISNNLVLNSGSMAAKYFSLVFSPQNLGTLVTIYGSSLTSTTLTVQYSYDSSTFFDTNHTITTTTNFNLEFTTSAPYMRLRNDNSTIVSYILLYIAFSF